MNPSTNKPARCSSSRRRLATTLGAGIVIAGTLGGLSLTASASAPPAAGGDYCQAHLDLEFAFNSGADPSAAIEQAMAVVPEEIAGTLGDVLNNAQAGPGDPAFDAPYGELIGWVKDNCGFGSLEVLAKDYSYGGIPAEVPAGPTVISLVNEGEEMHEIILARRMDGVTESFPDLIMLPEEEAMTKVQIAGVAFAVPGGTGHTVVNLEPGDYAAICFIPVGTTAEVFAQMMAGMETMGTGMEEAPMGTEGPPHFMEGMIQEFTVVDGAAAPMGTG